MSILTLLLTFIQSIFMVLEVLFTISLLLSGFTLFLTCLYDAIGWLDFDLIAAFLSLSLDFLSLLNSEVNQGQYFCETLRY